MFCLLGYELWTSSRAYGNWHRVTAIVRHKNMARLIDRILDGCQPLTLANILTPSERRMLWRGFHDKYADEADPSRHAEDALSAVARIKATEAFDADELKGVPVFAADDVGHYVASLPEGLDFTDVVNSLAPPFDKFFVEFQGVRNTDGLHAWGALVINAPPEELTYTDDSGTVLSARWLLRLRTFVEYTKGKPIGPISDHYCGLADDGTWLRTGEDNSHFWAGQLVELTSDVGEVANQQEGDWVANLLFPVLLAISFAHCKNVEVLSVEPDAPLNRKHRKRTGRDLTRYHVLKIDPLRKLLQQHRESSDDSLGRALHLCRGHFKTFTEDAPLYGKHMGTYWWGPQVRGRRDAGVIEKDYRVQAPVQFGIAYTKADENATYELTEAPAHKDPDSMGRGLSAHGRIQNFMAETVRQLNYVPRSPQPDEPKFDVAWQCENSLFVCEVKSTTKANEEKQLQKAIGQVIRYRQRLGALGFEPVRAVVAVENSPSDQTWIRDCEREGILLIWPDVAKDQLKTAIAH